MTAAPKYIKQISTAGLFYLAGAATVGIFRSESLHWPIDWELRDLVRYEITLTTGYAAWPLWFLAAALFGFSIFAFQALSGGVRQQLPETTELKAVAVADLLSDHVRTVMAVIDQYAIKNTGQLKQLDFMRREAATTLSAAEVRQLIERMATICIEATRDANTWRDQLSSAQAETEHLKRGLTEANALSGTDFLTGLANRRAFDAHLRDQVALHHASRLPFCLIVADIDHFKTVNDNFGHQVGDAVLKEFAQALDKSVRSTDMVARYGGEEFAIALPRTSMGNAIEVAERMRRSLQGGSWACLPSGSRAPTGSFGVAEIVDGDTPGELFERADRMLYAAKRTGRDRVVHDSAAMVELEIKTAIRTKAP
jgi:diguanylate cyclase